MQIEDQIKAALADTLNILYNFHPKTEEILLQKTKKEFVGDYTLVVFPYTKIANASPEATAQKIGELLAANKELITSFNVVKGFLNLELNNQLWINHFNSSCLNDKYGFKNIDPYRHW